LPFDIFLIVVGVILSYVGYQISNKTQSDFIKFMGVIVLVVGLILIANGIGVISVPPLPS